MHYPSPEERSDDGNSDNYDGDPGINIGGHPNGSNDGASNGSRNNNECKDIGSKENENDRTRSRFPFRFKMFGCIGVKG